MMWAVAKRGPSFVNALKVSQFFSFVEGLNLAL